MYESIATAARKLLVVDREPLGAAQLNEMLAEHGWSCVVVTSVASALKSIRGDLPAAIIVRAALHDPEFGCDHIVRVLRQTYPGLPIVITSTQLNRRVEAIRSEFGVPCLVEPFDTAELFAALKSARDRASSISPEEELEH